MLLASLLVTPAFAGPAICSAPVEHFIDSSGFGNGNPFPTTQAALWTWVDTQLENHSGKLAIKADVCCPSGQRANSLQQYTWVNVKSYTSTQNGMLYRWDFSFNAVYCAVP